MKPLCLPTDRDDGPLPSRHSGISVEFTRRTGLIRISGWYDSMVGIEGDCLLLGEFFRLVGIRKQDCERAFK